MKKMELYNLSRTDWEFLIDEYILGRNAETRRKILKRRLLDGVTFEQLADEFCRAIYASTENEQERNIYFGMLDKLNKR